MATTLDNSDLALLPSPPLSQRRYCDAWRQTVTLCVCPPSQVRRNGLGGEGNVLYPVL